MVGDTSSIVTTLLSGLLSGIVVAVLTYLFSRRKTNAEIRKLEAETEKIRVEISKSVDNISATVNYKLSNKSEQTIYQSSTRQIGYDFRGHEDFVWKSIDGKDVAIGQKARGNLEFEEGGVLNIRRTNTEGRFQIWLQRYIYDGVEKTSIPRDDLISGLRSLRVSCEVKVVGGEHTLRFLLKNEKDNKWLGQEERRITSDTWTKLNMYFQIPPSEECRLRIDDEQVSHAPSSVQITSIVLAEKTI
jgi:hypothetical protein